MFNRLSLRYFLLILVFFVFLFELEAVTVYTKDRVILKGTSLTIGDVISIPGVVDRTIEEILERPIPLPEGRFSLIPPGLIKSVLENYYKESIFVIGKPTMVIPEGLLEDHRGYFFSALLNFIRERYPASRGRTAYHVIKREGPLPPAEDSISFFLPFPEEEEKLHLFYTLEGLEALGEVVVIREHISGEKLLEEMEPERPFGSPAKDTLRFTEGAREPYSVRGGDRISIRFIKKNIRLTMEGRSYDSGRPGESVSVSPWLTGKRFSGRVTGIKEVTVEIP